MKMAIASSIALACLLAGADAFGTMPKPGPATCDGHTGNLAVLAALGSSCDNIAYGHHDPTPGLLSCENADGSDNLHNIGPGVDLDLKALCPEKCGVPCGHAPEVDINAIGANWGLNATDPTNCAALRDGGLCESELLANWFCGESCRGGAPWDECMWIDDAFVPKSAREQIDDDCAVPSNLAAWGYQDAAACVSDNVATYLGTSAGTCPGSPSGADCYYDQKNSRDRLSAAGSTQVNKCPEARRRKLTVGTHSDAMKTKGVFTLTASGSK